MSVKAQQVTGPQTANALRPAVNVKNQVRGSAGNHTLISRSVLQRKCACGDKCEQCKKPEDGTLIRHTHTQAIGVSGGFNFRLDRRVALQVLGEVSGGKAFDIDNERGFKFLQLGLSFGITFE